MKKTGLFTIAVLLVSFGASAQSFTSNLVSSAVSAKISAKSKLLACENKVKSKLKNGELAFTRTGHQEMDTYLDRANGNLHPSGAVDRELQVTFNRMHHVLKLAVSNYRIINQTQVEDFVGEIEISPDTEKSPMNVQLNATVVIDPQFTATVSQVVNFSVNCEPKAVEANVTLLKVTGRHLVIEDFDQTIEKKDIVRSSGAAEIPEGKLFVASTLPAYGGDKLKDFYSHLIGQKLVMFGNVNVPLMNLRIEAGEVDERLNQLTQEKEDLSSFNLVWSDDSGSRVNEYKLYYSTTSAYGEILELNGFTNSVFAEDAWTKKKITASSDTLSDVKFNEADFDSHKKLEATLKTNLEVIFPNLDAYWQVESNEPIDSAKSPFKYSYSLLARRKPISKESLPLTDTSTRHPEFLKSTYYVESEIHDIQSLIEHLREGFHGTRTEFAEKILGLVNVLIVFDDEMLDNNTIAPLKTSEILKRGRGVCQHFAILFAALSRAAGIPTRIISGYSIDAAHTYDHAWDEIEISDGVWLPVEPQYKHLYKTEYWAYMPLTVSAELDDPTRKDDMIKEQLLMTNFAFSLKQKKTVNERPAVHISKR